MCGIVGSFDLAKIELGFEHVQQRGTKGYSLSVVDVEKGTLLQTKAYDAKSSSIQQAIADASYPTTREPFFVLHVQSPTGLVSKPHPACSREDTYLWHNGMLNSMEYRSETEAEWDTQLLIDNIVCHGIVEALSSFEGSFACLMLSSAGLLCFRNAIAPLYYSLGGTLSSSNKFEGSVLLAPGKLYKIQQPLGGYDLDVVGHFNNSHNPFGV